MPEGGVQLDLGVLPARVLPGILVLLVLQHLFRFPVEYFGDPSRVGELSVLLNSVMMLERRSISGSWAPPAPVG